MISISDHQRKINIGLLEVRRHPAVLYTFCKICKIPETSVTIFTTPSLYKRLLTWLENPEQYRFVLKKDQQPLHSYLKQIQRYCETHIDLLFVNTIHESWYDLFHFSRFHPKIPTILTVHHVNAWLNPKKHMDKMSIITKINAIFMNPFIKNIIYSYDGINVIYSPLKKYIINTLGYQKPVFTLPSAVYEQTQYKKTENNTDKKLNLVIPGLVQQHRKDFKKVLAAFQSISPSVSKRIKLILLGTAFDAAGKKIIHSFQSLHKQGLSVHTFDSFIDDETFYQYIKQSDMLLLPIKIQTRSDNNITETYGKTVGSGVVYDAIKYAKPVIIPHAFHILEEFKDASISYHDQNDLKTIITHCVNNPSIVQKKKELATINASQFSLDFYQTYFKETILPWLKKHKHKW